MKRLLVVPLAAFTLLAPQAHAATPQVTDPAGDANFLATASGSLRNTSLPVGNQDYADVLSIEWANTKVGGKKAFTVTTTLSGAPTPAPGTSLVYRMLGTTSKCPIFGVAYYTHVSTDPTIPQAAVRDNCQDGTTIRLTKLELPKIDGAKITWTVPLSVIPADTKVASGTTVSGLWFQVNEIQSWPCNPVTGELGFECGAGAGTVDNSAAGDAKFTIG